MQAELRDHKPVIRGYDTRDVMVGERRIGMIQTDAKALTWIAWDLNGMFLSSHATQDAAVKALTQAIEETEQ